MAIVDNRNISLEGRKIGVHPIVTLFLIGILLILMLVPTYHMSNAMSSVFDMSNTLAYCVIGLIAFAISTVEPMLSQSIYHNEGTSNNARKDVSGRFWLLICVFFVTAMGGWSHHVTTSKDDIQRTSHNTLSRTFSDDLESIELEYQTSMATAKDKDKIGLDIKRRQQRSALNRRYAAHQAAAVAPSSELGRAASTLLYCLLSLIVSIATITYSRFILRFSLSITEIPIIDYISKLGQDWKTGKAEGSNNIIDHGMGRKTALRGDLETPKIELRNVKEQWANVDDIRPAPNRPAPYDSTVGAVSGDENHGGERSPKPEYSETHYQAIKQSILSGDFNPTQAPVKKELVRLRVQFIDDAERQRKAVEILNQLQAEGVIIENPAQKDTKQNLAKFVVNPDHQPAQNLESTTDENLEQGDEEMIRSTCPECQHTSRASKKNIKRWQGAVGCPECRTDYLVADNLAKPIHLSESGQDLKKKDMT